MIRTRDAALPPLLAAALTANATTSTAAFSEGEGSPSIAV